MRPTARAAAVPPVPVLPGLLAGLLACLLAGLLAGCAPEEPVDTYCAEVVAQREALTEAAAAGGPTALLDVAPSLEALRDASPPDLRDDWDVVVGRLGALDDALSAAGVDPGTYDRTDPPADLAEEERTAIEAAARQLATPEMVAALSAVQQQARDVCGTSLVV